MLCLHRRASPLNFPKLDILLNFTDSTKSAYEAKRRLNWLSSASTRSAARSTNLTQIKLRVVQID
jgi:hypothetical protein